MKRFFRDLVSGLIITISFFTIIPMPIVEWKNSRIKYMPIFYPIVGLVIGMIIAIIEQYIRFNYGHLSLFTLSIVIVVLPILLTGGLHIDALMDTTDAHLSRKPREQKLKIMKDPTVGAFAVTWFVIFFIIKLAIVHELLLQRVWLFYPLVFIPMISRFIIGSMLINSKFASKEGLAKMYDGLASNTLRLVQLVLMFLFFAFVCIIDFDFTYVLGGVFIFYLYYKYIFCYRQFGGITGDLVGAFLELSELLMLFIILLLNI